MANGITPRIKDYSQWYLDIVTKAELADYAPVKGCMVIRPNGYELWENVQKNLDSLFKSVGVRNAYFPLLIPESFMRKEAKHVDGFAPECAVVTHGGGKKLEENLYIRPTSETIIWSMYSKWIQSYRELPLVLNQWCNVLRWEMRTRLFLRTSEFLWQEGHTAHASEAEANARAKQMLEIYKTFVEEFMAIPVLAGDKTPAEKFAGANITYSIEGMMQDKKALQLGTSHDLGQNFGKAFDVQFINQSGTREHVWGTSWGVSTRLIGALIMAHSDDQGLVIPPRLATTSLVLIPIWRQTDERSKIIEFTQQIKKSLEKQHKIILDDREQYRPGFKFNEWELKGIPLRIEIGPKDVENKQVIAVRRDNKQKIPIPVNQLIDKIPSLLNEIQHDLLAKARIFQQENTKKIDHYPDLKNLLNQDGGFAMIHWCGSSECEKQMNTETKGTIRCIPWSAESEPGHCPVCQKTSSKRVVYAKAY